ncbi:MAG: Ferric uptake regulation protein [SAR116 cluster bacterium MED-G04]|nr:MAG: Ferric uptake regulation protein [SAR116 cluster bacterium MED-G04]HCD49853.1 transcriptional repressor [Alphaproteobacteria bacterium]HCV62547.1 transcriptional repressor [Alphaproteobacteria bacterium]
MAKVIDKCLEAGVRMTHQRRIIIELIDEADDHPDVETIYRRAIAIDRTISLATIYRTVGVLEEVGVIEKLEVGDGKARYEMAGDHHEHLVDVDSGEIHEFQHEELERLKETIARDMGFELVGHRLELFGRKIR